MTRQDRRSGSEKIGYLSIARDIASLEHNIRASLAAPVRRHVALRRGRLGRVGREAVGKLGRPESRLFGEGRKTGEAEKSGLLGEGAPGEKLGAVLHVGEIVKVEPGEVGGACEPGLPVAHVVAAAGGGVSILAVEVVQGVREDVLRFRHLARGRSVGRQGGDLLRGRVLVATVALGLAVVGRGKVGKSQGFACFSAWVAILAQHTADPAETPHFV